MFESILTTTDTTISAGTSILSIFGAMALGVLIALCYMYSQKKNSYSKDFVIALVLLPIIVAVVIMLVGSSTARALSLAGAFALVRFRSAPGSAKDIAVVFFAMGAGLAAGLGFILFGAVFTLIICVVLLILSRTGFADGRQNERLLKITIPEDLNYQGAFDDLFNEYSTNCTLSKVKTTNMGTLFELSYLISLRPDVNDKDLIDLIRCRNGNLNITLGMVPDRNGQTL